jgi:hypothetical protein
MTMAKKERSMRYSENVFPLSYICGGNPKERLPFGSVAINKMRG